MINLDAEKEIKNFDKGRVLQSIRQLPAQVEQAWTEVKELDIPQACRVVNNVVVCGMGGSALGGRIVDSLVADRVRVPMEIISNYDVPNYVGPESLVIVTSYSGNTEETMAAAQRALVKRAKIFGITTGGKLAEFLKKEKIPAYIYKPKENPSNQPRLGLGYSVAATMTLLARCGFFTLAEEDMRLAIKALQQFSQEFDSQTAVNNNLAKRMALKLKNKIPPPSDGRFKKPGNGQRIPLFSFFRIKTLFPRGAKEIHHHSRSGRKKRNRSRNLSFKGRQKNSTNI